MSKYIDGKYFRREVSKKIMLFGLTAFIIPWVCLALFNNLIMPMEEFEYQVLMVLITGLISFVGMMMLFLGIHHLIKGN